MQTKNLAVRGILFLKLVSEAYSAEWYKKVCVKNFCDSPGRRHDRKTDDPPRDEAPRVSFCLFVARRRKIAYNSPEKNDRCDDKKDPDDGVERVDY